MPLSVLTPNHVLLPPPPITPPPDVHPLAPSLAVFSRTGGSVPGPSPHLPNTHASLLKGHSPGRGHLGWPPEKNPEQYPGDAGTDEPDPVCGGLTFVRLSSPLPPGSPTPAPPHTPAPWFSVHVRCRASHLPGGHGQQEGPSSAPAMRRHPEYVQLR